MGGGVWDVVCYACEARDFVDHMEGFVGVARCAGGMRRWEKR